jgi:hypothetical protein
LSNVNWDRNKVEALPEKAREWAKHMYRNDVRSLEDLQENDRLFENMHIRHNMRFRYNALRPATLGIVSVPIDPVGYTSKEEQEKNFKDIRHRLWYVSNWKHIPDAEFAAQCATGHCFGYCWVSPNRGTSSDYWDSFQATALDFDGTLPLTDFLQRCETVGVHPSFVYKTFSYGVKGERYRAVFILTHSVRDVQIWRAVMFSLAAIFPEADKCFDAAHVFRGGNGLLHENYGVRNYPVTLLERALFYKYSTNPAHHSEFIAKFAGATGLCFLGRYLDIIPHSKLYVAENLKFEFIDIGTPVSGFKGKMTPLNGLPCINTSDTRTTVSQTDVLSEDPYYHFSFPLDSSGTQSWYLKSVLTESQARRHILQGVRVSALPSIEKPGRQNGRVVKDWAGTLEQRCECFRAFKNHSVALDHDARFMLACNLTKLSGGEKAFLDGMDSPLYSAESRKKWQYDVREIKQRYGESPYVTCEYGRCPFRANCQKRGTSMMSLLPRKKWEIRAVGASRPTTALEESRHKLEAAFRTAYQARDNCVHVIRSDTGVGKSHAVVNTLLENTAVASPTHALNEETYARYSMGQALLWRGLPKLPEHFQHRIDQRNRSGLGKVTAIVREWLDSCIPLEYRDVERRCYEYLHATWEIRRAGVVFLTHEKVFSLVNPRVRTVIFDEDPIYSLLKTTIVLRADVNMLLLYLRGKRNPALQPIIGYLESLQAADASIKERTDSFPLSTVMGLLRDDGAPQFQSPVASLFSCHFYHRSQDGNISCLERRALDPNRKYIILSATANESVYRKLFGDRLRFIDLSGTETKGTLVLHSEQSYSRFNMAKLGKDEMSKAVTAHAEQYGLDGVIVYKASAEGQGTERLVVGTNVPVLCHYGAQYGLNGFSGKCIGIYGVPHKPGHVYKMYGRALGIDCGEDMKVCEVERNGYEFSLWTYEDADLREIQLWMLESELLQAVGRARLVSEPDAAVHLFSNYPLPGCVLAE